VVRARFVLPLVVVCALTAAAPALATPHVGKAQSRMITHLVVRWVNDVVRGRDLADGWKIAGAAERGATKRKMWVSGRQLPVMHDGRHFPEVLNNPRTAWYVTGKSKQRHELYLVVSLKTGHGRNREMLENEMTLRHLRGGRWVVYDYYTDGIFRLGKGHYGSCTSSKCQVTGINDYKAGGPSTGSGSSTSRISGVWRDIVFGAFISFPFLALLSLALVAFVKSRRARRARLAYMASRTS
jgi:hypothetical protein